LDAEAAKAIQAVFGKTKKDRTMVAVAHKLTVQNADMIFNWRRAGQWIGSCYTADLLLTKIRFMLRLSIFDTLLLFFRFSNSSLFFSKPFL
jgi:hypothetical protein